MRAKRIAAQVKAQGRAELWDVADSEGVVRQWISTGVAAYPVDGMPYLRVDNLPALLSLSEKELEKILLEAADKPERIDLRDCVEAEAHAQDQGLVIGIGGHEIMPVLARGRTYMIDTALLTPILAEHKAAELWLREAENGWKYFAAKSGLLLVGIVLPLERQDSVANALTLLGEAYRGDERGVEAPYGETEDEPGEGYGACEDNGQEVPG